MKKAVYNIATAACFLFFCALTFAGFAAKAEEPAATPKIVGKVLEIVEKKFVHKDKIAFQEMLEKGVNNLEITIDEVLVEWLKNENAFEMVVGENKRRFEYEEPQTWKDIREISNEVFSFVSKNLKKKEKPDNTIEYAMVNGMLSTVDRHSHIIPPQNYEEFIVGAEGSFSGLGIVIGARKGWITVVSPIEDTPAYHAGIKSGDRIVQIENESTVNMSTVEAAHRLRGPKGKPVNIRILRDSMDRPRTFTIVRDTIKIESVEEYLFDDNILYIKIKNFQRNTTDSIVEALKKRKTEKKLAGIILDFRDNPGGLLDQAAKISDLFLKYGTVFSIESGDNIRPYSASGRSRFELREKTVILVNSGSASASEIVTGALKENDRALTMGTKTFGKGTVQDIFQLEDGSALKLTVAKYLIPGNISIHKVGITPDIFIEEVDFSKNKTIYKTPEFVFRLEKYREENKEDTRVPEPPSYTFKILNESLITDENKDGSPDEIPKTLSKEEKKEKKEKDPLVMAARRIIAGSDGTNRGDMLKNASDILSEIDGEEDRQIRKKLAGLGVDWSDGLENPGAWETEEEIKLEAEITPDGGIFRAGEEMEITVQVSNTGKRPVFKLTAVTDSENWLLDGREFIFGKIAPGEKTKWKTRIKIPNNAQTRNDECALRFFDSSGGEILSETFTVGMEKKKHPAISYSYEIVDDGRFGSNGNGDGRIGKDETIALLFRAKNTGEGKAEDIGFYLKNRSGEKLFLEKAIDEVGEFSPGETRDIAMRFRVEDKWGEKNEKAELELMANDFQIGFSSRIQMNIPAREPVEFVKKEGAVQLRENTEILSGSFEEAQPISFAEAGSSYRLEGTAGKWSKIEIGEGGSGWIKTGVTSPFDGETFPKFKYILASPPVIRLNPHAVVTDREEIEISGFVEDVESVVNISFFNNNDKINIINSEGAKQDFVFNLPLEDGMNELTITAKDSNDLRSVQTFLIRKKS